MRDMSRNDSCKCDTIHHSVGTSHHTRASLSVFWFLYVEKKISSFLLWEIPCLIVKCFFPGVLQVTFPPGRDIWPLHKYSNVCKHPESRPFSRHEKFSASWNHQFSVMKKLCCVMKYTFRHETSLFPVMDFFLLRHEIKLRHENNSPSWITCDGIKSIIFRREILYPP